MAQYIKILFILILCNIHTQNVLASSSYIIEEEPRTLSKLGTSKNGEASRSGLYSLWDKVKYTVSSIIGSSYQSHESSVDQKSNPSWWEASTSKGQEWEKQWNSMVMFVMRENINHSKLLFSTTNYREAIYASEGRNLSHHTKLRKVLGGDAQQEGVRDRLFHQNAKNIHLKQYAQFLSSFKMDQRENFPLIRQSLKDFYQKVRGTSIEGDYYDGDLFQKGHALAECLWKIGDLKRQASNLNLLREIILRSYKLMNGGELDELIYDDLKAAAVIAPSKQTSTIIRAVKGSSLLLLTLSASLISTSQAVRSVGVLNACGPDFKKCNSGFTLLDFYGSSPEVNSILSNSIVINATQNSMLHPNRLTALSMALDNIDQLTNTTGWLSEVTTYSVSNVPTGNATYVSYNLPAPFVMIDSSLINDTSYYYNAYRINDIYQPAESIGSTTESGQGAFYFLDQFPNSEVWFLPVMVNDTFGVGTAVIRPSQGNPSILWQRVMTKESSFNTTESATLPLRTIELNKPARATEEQGLTQDDLENLYSGNVGDPYCAGNQTIPNYLSSQSNAITTLANKFITCMQNPVLDASSCFRVFGTFDSAYFRLSYFFMEDNLGSRLYTRRIYDGPSYKSCSYREISSNQVQEDCHAYTWTPVISNINSTSQLLPQSLSSISGSTAPGNVHKILEYFFTSASVDGIVVHTVQNSSGVFGPNYYAYCPTPTVPTVVGPTSMPTDASEPTQSPSDSNIAGLSDDAKIGIGVGIGGAAVLGTGAGLLAWKLKKNKEGSFVNNEDNEKNGGRRTQSNTFPITQEGFTAVEGQRRFAKGRMTFEGNLYGYKYGLYFKIDPTEAQEITHQTDLKIEFPENQDELDLILGAGQFGQVRVAREEETHERLFRAIKIVAGEQNVKASLREGALQARLNGKTNVLPLLEYLHYRPTAQYKRDIKELLTMTFGSTTVQGQDMTTQDLLLQVTPLAAFGNGWTFQDKLAQVKDLKLKNMLLNHVAYSMLTGLKNMHDDGVSHLDVKPTNFLIHTDGTVYVSDFGCAQQRDNLKGGIGDFSYFSPERLAHIRFLEQQSRIYQVKEVEPFFSGKAADSWAAGITLLEIANNAYPFDCNTDVIGMLNNWNKAYYAKSLAESFVQAKQMTIFPILKGLLSLDPEERWSTTKAQDELKKNLTQDSPESLFHLLDDALLEGESYSPREAVNNNNFYERKEGVYSVKSDKSSTSQYYGTHLSSYHLMQQGYDEEMPLLSPSNSNSNSPIFVPMYNLKK